MSRISLFIHQVCFVKAASAVTSSLSSVFSIMIILILYIYIYI